MYFLLDSFKITTSSKFFKFILFLAVLSLCCCAAVSLVVEMGAPVQVWCRASHYRGFSCSWGWALGHRLSTCVAQAWLLCDMWDLPRPRIKPITHSFNIGLSHLKHKEHCEISGIGSWGLNTFIIRLFIYLYY